MDRDNESPAGLAESLQQVDKYRLLSLVGEGGMGQVYRAALQGPGGASKVVALKLIHPHLSRRAEVISMFLNEMRVAMALSHRNIVQTFDAGEHEERYFIVMEYMNGGSLSELQRLLPHSQLFPLDVALPIAMEVCAALDYAHHFRADDQRVTGIIHRDVSPANILFSDQGDIKLTDFGVAKGINELARQSGRLIKGKLSYMAPEQAFGQAEPRSDLFALAAVLYHVLAKRPLREEPTLEQVRGASGQIAALAHIHPGVTESLQGLLERCLAHEPAERPASAEELRRLLGEELDRVQRAQDGDRDWRARLRELLACRHGPTLVQGQGADEKVRRVAEAMRAMALEVPARPYPLPSEQNTTDEHQTLRLSEQDAETTPYHRKAAAAVDEGMPRRRPQVLLWMGILVVLAGGTALGWHYFRAQPLVAGGSTQPLQGRPTSAHLSADARATRDTSFSRGDTGVLSRSKVLAEQPEGQPPRRASGGAPKRGSLEINSIPWAEVYVDERRVGETPLQGYSLRAGRHTVLLVNPTRGLFKRFSVYVREGQRVQKSVRLLEQER